MRKPKISIITPTYNAAEYVAEAIESVRRQSFTDYEHIIIDDGSTDSTSDVVDQYAADDKRIIYIKQENQGPAAARNKGIDRARAAYVIFLDADDLYAPDTLKLLFAKSKETDADIVFYNFVYHYGSDTGDSASHRIELDESIVYTKEKLSKNIFNVFPILTCNKMIKRELLSRDKVRFNTDYLRNEDVDFSVRATLAADTYAYVNYVGYYYRISNPNSETATNFKHPTQLLQILIDLNQLVEAEHPNLKQSFDNYAVNQTIGSVNMQEAYADVQRKVFDFAADKVVPELRLQEIGPDYLYQPELFESFIAIRDKNYPEILRSRIKLLNNHAKWLEDCKHRLENHERSLEGELQKIHDDYAKQTAVVDDLSGRLDSVYRSLSWKVTKPLRGVDKAMRAIRRGN